MTTKLWRVQLLSLYYFTEANFTRLECSHQKTHNTNPYKQPHTTSSHPTPPQQKKKKNNDKK